MKTIAVDIDDVIADSTNSYRKRVNEQTGANLQPEHYRVEGEYWGYYERVWREHGIVVNYEQLEAEMIEDQTRIPLLPGAQFALSRLSESFHIVIVTARNALWEEATKKWLKNHFRESAPDVYFSKAHHVPTEKTKGQVCKQVGAFWLIDDNVQHCQSAVKEGIKAILFGNYGWHGEVPDNITKCSDWAEVLEYFDAES